MTILDISEMSREARKPGVGVSDKVRLKPACTVSEERILKCWVEVEGDLYYLSSEDKGADQLCSNCTADLRLCFRIGKHSVFS